MRAHRREAGSVSVAALAFLFFIAAVAGGGALILGTSLSRERKSAEAGDLRGFMRREIFILCCPT